MSDRWINATAEAIAAAEHSNYAFLCSFDFQSQPIYVFNGLGQISFNGHTYDGLGVFGSCDEIGESSDLRPANPVVFNVAGVDPSFLALAEVKAEYYRRSARIDIAIFNEALQLVTPIENAVWEGSMDTVALIRSEGAGSVKLTCESILAIWDKAIGFLYTDEHQQAAVPDDTGFNHIAENRDKEVFWGGAVVTTGTRPGFFTDTRYRNIRP